MHPAIICLLYFISGAAGLVFEIIWCRLLLRGLGAGTSASACVFAAFMVGAALGAFALWRYPKAIARLGSNFARPAALSLDYFRAFGRLELIAGVSGLLACLFLSSGAGVIAQLLGPLVPHEALLNISRFILSFLILLVPTSAMGGSLAAVLALLKEHRAGKNFFSILYGFNMLGAAAGCMGSSYFLMPTLGIKASALLAAALNFTIFAVVELTAKARKIEAEQGSPLPAEDVEEASDKRGAESSRKVEARNLTLLFCVFYSGFLALVFEIVWNRIFSLVLGASSYSLSAVLLMVLSGGGSAALLIQILRINRGWAKVLMITCFFLAGLYTLLTCFYSHLIFWIFFESSTYLSRIFTQDPFTRALIARLILAGIYIFPPSMLLGAILPLASRAKVGNETEGTWLYAINCLGAAIGCLAFSLLIFPLLSNKVEDTLQASLIGLSCASIFAALLLSLKEVFTKGGWMRRSTAILASILILRLSAPLLSEMPEWNSELMSSGTLIYKNETGAQHIGGGLGATQSLLKIVEGINSTVTLSIAAENNSICLSSDGKVESTLPLHRSIISPGTDISTHLLLGELPVLFHNGEVNSAFLIGLGSGVTASSLLAFPELKQLKIAELEPAVSALCKHNLGQFNGNPFSKSNIQSGRIDLRLCDARFLLLAENRSYDIIVSQPADPWVSGSGDLFTEDFWKIASSRLNKNGIFCQWVQLYAIPEKDLVSLIQTFRSVFKTTEICHAPGAGELILIGFKEPANAEAATTHDYMERSESRIVDASKSNSILACSGISSIYSALSMILLDAEASRRLTQNAVPDSAIHNTDDFPFVEFSTCKSMLTSDSQLDGNLKLLAAALEGEQSNTTQACRKANTDCARLSRSYAEQALQDSSGFKSYLENRSLACAIDACSKLDSPSNRWSKAIVLRSLKKESEARAEIQIALKLPVRTDEDRMALFDIEFEQDKLADAENRLSTCNAKTLESVPGLLRQGYLQLRQNRADDACKTFARLLELQPCHLPGLLGSAYALSKCKRNEQAAEKMKDYLRINPWDGATQLAYTSLLSTNGEPDEAARHAACASRLRPYDASPYILALSGMLECDWKSTSLIKEMQQEVFADPNCTKILEITDNGKNPKNLLKNQWFTDVVNYTKTRAEDPKNGYKMLGEP